MNHISMRLQPQCPDQIYVISHNGHEVFRGTVTAEISLQIQQVQAHNHLMITVDRGWTNIDWICMFGMGQHVIKHRGYSCLPGHRQVPGHRIMMHVPWVLEYQSPVFQWLMPAEQPGWYYRFD